MKQSEGKVDLVVQICRGILAIGLFGTMIIIIFIILVCDFIKNSCKSGVK